MLHRDCCRPDDASSVHIPWNNISLWFFPSPNRLLMHNFDMFFVVSMDRLMNDQSSYRWFPKPWRSFIWRHCNDSIHYSLTTELGRSTGWMVCWRFTDKSAIFHCPACRTSLIATRFWVVVICPIIKCLTVLEFSFILFDLCLFITIFNFILNYVPILTFWIFTYHKIWILLIIFCFIWNYWIIYFWTCLEVFWSVVS